MKDAFIYWKRKKNSGGWSWIYLGSSVNFRHRIWNDFETLGLCITFSKWVPPFFSAKTWIEKLWAYLQQVTQPASGVKCPLTLLPPWSWSLSAPPWRPAWQAAAVLGRFRKPAYQTSGPLHSVDDLRVSNCLNFSNKWNKSHPGSPWLLEPCTWWTTPRSRWTPPGFRRNCSVCVDKLRCMSHTDLLVFVFLWLFFVRFSNKESF